MSEQDKARPIVEGAEILVQSIKLGDTPSWVVVLKYTCPVCSEIHFCEASVPLATKDGYTCQMPTTCNSIVQFTIYMPTELKMQFQEDAPKDNLRPANVTPLDKDFAKMSDKLATASYKYVN